MHIQVTASALLRSVLTALLTLCLPTCLHAAPDKPVQSQESFEAAVGNRSTAPSYVMITVIDAQSEQRRTICVTANLLLGAIHREHQLDYTPADRASATDIARASNDHVFRFHQKALANIPMRTTDEDVAAARTLLADYTPDELRQRFSLTSHSRLEIGRLDRAAIACALIERGLSPRMADRSGQVYLSQ